MIARSTTFVMCQLFYLETALETNGVAESDVKEVIKKLLKNPSKQKSGEKTQMMEMIGLIPPMCFKISNCIVGIICYGLILGHHEFIFS